MQTVSRSTARRILITPGIVIRATFTKDELASLPQFVRDVIDVIECVCADNISFVAVSQHVGRWAREGVAEEDPSTLVRRVATKG
jgi:hypothetical protein